MYSYVELEFILNNCCSLHEIAIAMTALLYVKADGDLTDAQVEFIREKSLKRVREI